MLIHGVQAVREQVKGDGPLAAAFEARYGRPAKFWLGIKQPQKSSDYPCLCFALLGEERLAGQRRRRQRIGIAWFLNQPEVDDAGEVFRGVVDTAEIGELVFRALKRDFSVGGAFQVEPDVETLTDTVIKHPYYQGEMVIEGTVKER